MSQTLGLILLFIRPSSLQHYWTLVPLLALGAYKLNLLALVAYKLNLLALVAYRPNQGLGWFPYSVCDRSG